MSDSNVYERHWKARVIRALQEGQYQEAMKILNLHSHRDSFPCNMIHIMVAEPLAYNEVGSILAPFPEMKILRREFKETLHKLFKDVVTVNFDFATENLLQNTISNNEAKRIIHLVCHGEQGCLALENGEGGVIYLAPDKIKSLYRTDNIDLMLITACHSQKAGMAFIEAGVRHVICCREDRKISDIAVMAFSEKFYQGLIQQLTVIEAFEHAQNYIKHTLGVEMGSKNFILLPRYRHADYHKRKVIFGKSENKIQSENTLLPILSTIPKVPFDFVGRQAEACEIIRKFNRPSISVIHLKGVSGIGKRTLASFVATYTMQRQIFNAIAWFPPLVSLHDNSSPLEEDLFKMFEMITSKTDFMNPEYVQCRHRIVYLMGQNKFLMVFDLCSMKSDVVFSLCEALREFLGRNIHLRVLLLSGEDMNIQDPYCYQMNLIPLTYLDMVRLFAASSPYVDQQRLEHTRSIAQSVQDFQNYVFRRDSFKMDRKVNEQMTKRAAELFHLLGNGIPKLIKERCNDLDNYQKIRKVAMLDDVMLKKEYDTRYELDRAILWYKAMKSKAKADKQFILCYMLSDVVEQLEYRQSCKLSEQKLRELIDDKSMERAIESTIQVDSAKVICLEDELSRLRLQLEEEKAAESRLGNCYQVPNDDLPLELQKAFENTIIKSVSDECVDEKMIKIGSLLPVKDRSIPFTCSRLPSETTGIVREYVIRHETYSFKFVIQSGSLAAFSSEYGNAGIVVASNECCMGNVGILSAVTMLGGQRLLDDVRTLPTIDMKEEIGEVRCLPGDAVKVSGGPYGEIPVKVIIFAVGPWFAAENANHRVEILRKSYQRALEIAKDSKLEVIAFSLIGASSRSGLDWRESITTGINTIASFQGYEELKEIHLFGFYDDEVNELETSSKKSCKNFPFMFHHHENVLTNDESLEISSSDSSECTESERSIEKVSRKLNMLEKELNCIKEIVAYIQNDKGFITHQTEKEIENDGSTSTTVQERNSTHKSTNTKESDVESKVGKIVTVVLDPSVYESFGVIERFVVQQPRCINFNYFIHRGSVLSFTPFGIRDFSAIVVASNEYCTSSNGVLQAVINCGGQRLKQDIEKLPRIGTDKKRCSPGQAVQVGRGQYGDLNVPYIIFAVASTRLVKSSHDRRETLIKAYQSALNIAKLLKLESVAFSLIGAGTRSEQNRKEAIDIGVRAICTFTGYPELKEIHHFAFDASEAAELRLVCHELFREIPGEHSPSKKVEKMSDQPTKLLQDSNVELQGNLKPSVPSQDHSPTLSKHYEGGVIDDSPDKCNREKVRKSNMMTRISELSHHSLQWVDTIASFLIESKHQRFYYTVHNGSIESFSSVNTLKSGIVVASNEKCSSSSGVLGTVTKCGGVRLMLDIKNLPKYGDDHECCLPGKAVLVGKGQYGSIKVPYIIFAVAPPPQSQQVDKKKPQILLMEAYQSALKLAQKAKLEAVAFSLIGAGNRSDQDYLRAIRIGVNAIATFEGYPELKEIHHYGYQAHEATELTKQCREWCKSKVKEIDDSEI